MKNDIERSQYISVVLNEVKRELEEAVISPTQLMTGLIKVGGILQLLTEYKSLGSDIIWHLDTSIALRTPINIFEYAAFIQRLLAEQISELESSTEGNRNSGSHNLQLVS